MIINTAGQSKIEAIKKLIEQRSFISTQVNFTGVGKVKSFPAAKLGRFVRPSGDFYQVVTRPGAYVSKKLFVGEGSVEFDNLPSFDGAVSFGFSNTIATASSISKNTAYFKNPMGFSAEIKDPSIFQSYSMEVQGTYNNGEKQLVFTSSLPLVIGDQILVSDNIGNSARVVIKNSINTNPNQWNVTLDSPIPFKIEDGSQVFVDASSVQYWESIPIDMGPCVLQLPIATHRTFADSQEVPISYVRLKNGDKEVEGFYISENSLQIPQANIPTSAWLAAAVIAGSRDYKDSCVEFIPELPPMTPPLMKEMRHPEKEFYVKLSFLDALNGTRINSWQFNINSYDAGKIYIKVNDLIKDYMVQPGLQTLFFEVPNEPINFIDIMGNTRISLGSVVCTNAVSNVDVAIHLFGAITLNSHVIGRPGLMEVIPSPATTWAAEGKAGVDRGYKLNPSVRRTNSVVQESINIKKDQNIFLTPPTAQILQGGTRSFTVSFTESNHYESFTTNLIGTDSTDGGDQAVDFASTVSVNGTTLTFTAGNAGETAKLKVTSNETGKVAISDIYVTGLFA